MNILTNRYLTIISSSVVCTVGIVLLKDYISGPKYTSPQRLDGKTVLITGANSGLGKELTRELSKRGAKIIMACKDIKFAKTVRDQILISTGGKRGDIVVRRLDLRSLESVASFVENIIKREETVDYVVNNAGVMDCKRRITKDGIEQHLAVNFLGHFLLTNLIVGHLRAPCKVVNVLCSQKNKNIYFDDLNFENPPYDSWKAYSQSKYALFLFTKESAKRWKSTCVCGVIPGMVNTNLPRNQIKSSSFIFRYFYNPFLWVFMKSPQQGVQPIMRALLEDTESGSVYYLDQPYEIKDEGEDTDAHRLWATSEVWTKLEQWNKNLSKPL